MLSRQALRRGAFLTRSFATATTSGPLPTAEAATPAVRNDWSREEIQAIYDLPLMDLVYKAATVHRVHQDARKVQLCTLHNIKEGGCTEDCSYCAQSSRYKTTVKAKKMADVDEVLEAARKAKANGSTRFCMGAAWRDMRGRKSGMNKIITMVKEIRAMDMEVCTTLGMVDKEQAALLREAGLTAYNHNLDTSREHYPNVITTRSYDERLATIKAVRDAGIKVCSGGIVGLGETRTDRVGLIHELSNLPTHPESVPINALVPIPGTPLGDIERLPFHDVLRTVAIARITMPLTVVRLAAGRVSMTEEQQALCFMAGANAVFTGERMLTTGCSGWEEDHALLGRWGMSGLGAFEGQNMVGGGCH
ncbi:biotin synthase [Saitoella complicata NRRL Y-17804]|uniref:biotin synthase n=1 Tax=Saitoella complicata (strain BCRC 22490 / CBS 7301 / JCM 7358 / NBRC 10748 / NRRL Y-17804) TaxID=698492 RepID=UPI00086696E2|nr:biotin synthase [Saitoella complicata NRRL Y-17804]ODQ50130.1 biotin synthase [Saitoella complicata NRRL Y-17804]